MKTKMILRRLASPALLLRRKPPTPPGILSSRSVSYPSPASRRVFLLPTPPPTHTAMRRSAPCTDSAAIAMMSRSAPPFLPQLCSLFSGGRGIVPPSPSVSVGFAVIARDFSSGSNGNGLPPPPSSPSSPSKDLVPFSLSSPPPPVYTQTLSYRFWGWKLFGKLVLLVIVFCGGWLVCSSRGLSIVLFVWSKISGSNQHGELVMGLEEIKSYVRLFGDFVEIFPLQFMEVAQQIYDALRSAVEDEEDEGDKLERSKKMALALLHDPEFADVLGRVILDIFEDPNGKFADTIAAAVVEHQKREKEKEKEKEKTSSWFRRWF